MREPIRKFQSNRDAIRPAIGQFRKGLRKAGFAISQNDPLNIARVDPAMHQRNHQIPTLLLRKSTDQPDQWDVVANRQANLLLQMAFASELSILPVRGRVTARDQVIVAGIPYVVIDPIDDALDPIGFGSEQPVKPAAMHRLLDLARVRRTHGGDHVGKGYSGLKKVQIPKKLHLLPVEVLPVHVGQRHIGPPESTLIRQIVNRHDRCAMAIPPISAIKSPMECGDQPRLPIVAMENVDRQSKPFDGFHHGSRKERKPLAIVPVIAMRVAIEIIAIEVKRLIDEVDIDGRSCGRSASVYTRQLRFQYMRRHRLSSHVDHKRDVRVVDLGAVPLRLAITRHEQTTVVPEFG